MPCARRPRSSGAAEVSVTPTPRPRSYRVGPVQDEQAEDLGDRPRADREVAAAEAEDEGGGGQRERRGDQAGEDDREERVDAEIVGEHDEA